MSLPFTEVVSQALLKCVCVVCSLLQTMKAHQSVPQPEYPLMQRARVREDFEKYNWPIHSIFCSRRYEGLEPLPLAILYHHHEES